MKLPFGAVYMVSPVLALPASFLSLVCPLIRLLDSRLVISPHDLAAVGLAACHVEAKLPVESVPLDSLITVGLCVDGAGNVLATDSQDGRPWMPGSPDLFHLYAVRPAGGLQIHVIVSAQAFDFDDLS